MKTVKVKAYKKLSPTGKIENVDAHMRKLEGKMLAAHNAIIKNGKEMTKEELAKNAKIRTSYGNYANAYNAASRVSSDKAEIDAITKSTVRKWAASYREYEKKMKKIKGESWPWS